MGLLNERLLVADDTGDQPHRRFDDREGGHLPAVEDVVAERDKRYRQPEVLAGVFEDAFIDPLVASTGKHEPGFLRQFPRQGLGQRLPGGCRNEEARPAR